jgi:hypothetical protein
MGRGDENHVSNRQLKHSFFLVEIDVEIERRKKNTFFTILVFH